MREKADRRRGRAVLFITGSEIEGVHVLDHWAEFAHQCRSRMGVVPDMPATHNLVINSSSSGINSSRIFTVIRVRDPAPRTHRARMRTSRDASKELVICAIASEAPAHTLAAGRSDFHSWLTRSRDLRRR